MFSKEIPLDERIARDPTLVDLVKKIFLGTGQPTILPASSNPCVGTELTYHTVEAAKPFKGVIYDLFERIREVQGVFHVGISGDLLCFWSPGSNIVARTLMQYFPIGDGLKASGMYLRKPFISRFSTNLMGSSCEEQQGIRTAYEIGLLRARKKQFRPAISGDFSGR